MTKTKIVDKVRQDSVQAMKDKETAKLSTLRLLYAEFEKEKVNHKMTEVTGLNDDQAIAIINRQLKKLDKEIEAYVAVGRTTEKQEAEKELLKTYLPKQLSEEEVTAIVIEIANSIKESGGKIGQAMKELSAQLKGKADMKLVNKVAKEQFDA